MSKKHAYFKNKRPKIVIFCTLHNIYYQKSIMMYLKMTKGENNND